MATNDLPLGDIPVIPPPSQAKRQRKTRTTTTSSKSKSSSSITITQLEKALESQFILIGTLLSGFDTYDGQVVVDQAAPLAEALVELAKSNASVKRFLEGMVSTGAWAGVITVFGGQIALPIAVHHKMLPENLNNALALMQDIPLREGKGNGSENAANQSTNEV